MHSNSFVLQNGESNPAANRILNEPTANESSLLTATGGQPKTTHRFCEQKRFSKRALKSQTSIFTTGIGAAACWRSLLLRPHVVGDAERAAGTQQQPCGQSLVQPRPLLLSYALVGDRSARSKKKTRLAQERDCSRAHTRVYQSPDLSFLH